MQFKQAARDVEETAKQFVDKMIIDCLVKDGNVRDNPKMRGSELAGCNRKNTFRLHQTETSGIDGFGSIATETGNAVETLVRRNMIRNYGEHVLLWDMWIPKTNKMGLRYSGKADFLLSIEGIGMVVVDLKTATRLGTEKRVDIEVIKEVMAESDLTDEERLARYKKSKGGMRKSPVKLNAYLEQVISYATFFDVDYGMVHLISRSKESWNEPVTTDVHIVRITDEQKYQTITNMLMAQRLADSYMVSRRHPDYKKTTHCQYCDFQSYCWEELPKKFTSLTDEATVALYNETYPEAVKLYDEHRGMLAWIRDVKIKEAKPLKLAIQNPTEENIKKVSESMQISSTDLVEAFSTHFEMDSSEQWEMTIKVYGEKEDE
jgi:hypothetical protein